MLPTTYLTVMVVSTTAFSTEDQLRKRRRVAAVVAIGVSGALVIDASCAGVHDGAGECARRTRYVGSRQCTTHENGTDAACDAGRLTPAS
jgi:hypothetical protein